MLGLKPINFCRTNYFKVVIQDIIKTSPSWLNSFSFYEVKRFAGHSHWQNIKATKELKDALKQKTFNEVVRKMKVAVQENGGQTNPKLNTVLAKVLEEAKSKDIPSTTINTALQRLEQTKSRKGPQQFVEGRALSGCSIVIETFTEKPKWFRQSVQHILKIYGGRIADAGSCCHLFDYKGVIYVSALSDNDGPIATFTHDKVFELAIEAGAEDVVESVDENNEAIFKFICDAKELHQVKKSIIEHSLHPYEARLEYLPHTFVTMDDESLKVAAKFLNELENLEDVNQVFHNIKQI